MSIKSARQKAGLTQKQVATAINVNQSAVAQWESGSTQPRTNKLLELAKLLKCSVETLLIKDEVEQDIQKARRASESKK